MLSPVTKAAAGPGKAGGCRWIFFLGAENIVSSVGHAYVEQTCCPQVAGGAGLIDLLLQVLMRDARAFSCGGSGIG